MRTAILSFITVLIFTSYTFAQLRETGHEIWSGSMNFVNLAKEEALHPRKVRESEPENEITPPFNRPIPDGSLIHKGSAEAVRGARTTATMPASPTPTSTFESTLDNGTAIPPDTHGAVDANYCVTALNTEVHIQTRTGANVSAMSLNAFWSPVLPGGGSFDPRVHYDLYTNRWILISVCGANTSSSAILIGVSKTGDPTGGWWEYRVTADASGVNWLDFPNIGYNSKWIVITGDLFANSGGAYNGAKVFIFNKASLLSGTGATYTSFLQTNSFSISPALTFSATEPTMFAVENWNGTAGLMHVWRITGAVGAESMTSVGYPASSLRWWYSSYPVSGTPGADFAPQAGTPNKIQTNDDRVAQVVFMNNSLWFTHTVFLPYNPSANPTRASVQWWQTDTLGNPLQIGLIDDATSTNFFAFPSIGVNSLNDVLVGCSAFSPATYPSCAYALHEHTDPPDSLRRLLIFRNGMNSYYKTFSGGKNRWGDYSAAMTDPTNLIDFWTIQEATAVTINTWDTWWAYLALCSPPAAITGANNVCAGAMTTLGDATTGGTWTSSNPSAATVSVTGVVTGVAAGITVISYTVAGCSATLQLTVNAMPASISGVNTGCIGHSTMYADATPGGSWHSSNPGVATVNAATGQVNGIASGIATISYVLPTGCYAAKNITVIACTVTTAIPSVNGQSELKVVPNPNKGAFDIIGNVDNAGNNMIQINVTDLLGQSVYTSEVATLNGIVNAHISMSTTLPSGIYIVHIMAGNESRALRITVSR